MQKAVVVLKDAQMERLRAGKTVIIRLRDTEVFLNYESKMDDLFEDPLKVFRGEKR